MTFIVDGTNGLTFNDSSTQAKAGLVAGGTIATGTVTTLTTTTISDGTNSTSATNCIQGSAKAWVYFLSTGSVAASYNVSSVTKTGTGTYTVTFTNAFVDSSFAVSGSTASGYTFYVASKSTTVVNVGTFYNGGAADLACSVSINR
jgi:hypothetical protein